MQTVTAPQGTFTYRDGVWYFQPAPAVKAKKA